MGDFRARKRPPPRGEVGVGLRGERPLAGDAVSVEDNVCPRVSVEQQPLDLKHPNDDGALTRSELGGVAYTVTDHGDAGTERDELRTERVQRLEHSHLVVTHEHGERLHGRAVELVPALTGGHAGVGRELAGFCCVCHAHDSTGEPPLPQLHAASNSQATLPYPTVGSSLSGVLPTLGTLGTYGSSARRAASGIPRAHRVVVPATVYTWHTAAQVLRPASDMPHATDHGVGSSASDMPHTPAGEPALEAGEQGTPERRTFP